MDKTMVRTQIYLPNELYQLLKERAKAEGITLAQQVREALTIYFRTQSLEPQGYIIAEDDPVWNIIGMGEGDITDASTNHDQYIYRRDWDERAET